MAPRRSFRWFVFAFAVLAVLGVFYGPVLTSKVCAAGEDDIQASLRRFTQFYSLVEENFADKIDPDKSIYKGAVPGMLRTLDPHSSFFDPKEYQLLREDQRGQYYGVGMRVAPYRGKTIVIAPFPGSPAAKAGLRAGDVILSVDGKPTDGLSTSEVADLLKGQKGTEVKVIVQREGIEEPLKFSVIRGEIPRESVSEGFWLRPGIAYVSVKQFNENTSRELEEQFRKLGEGSIQGLILDLRNNPGGLLNEGVAVAERFLKKDDIIVSHRGRASVERPYRARRGSNYSYPVVVLVNQYSASAAEIVAGALQDHDRGWVLGETTFGKGLVQTVYPLSETTGLALTTAKYYTPSGRLIQRDYRNVSFFDYYAHKDKEQKDLQDKRQTSAGRTVYGGGGITPDERYTPPRLNAFQARLLQRHAFLTFAARQFSHEKQVKLPENWEPDGNFVEEFHEYLIKGGMQFTEAEFTEAIPWIKDQLRREMYIAAYGENESEKRMILRDPMVTKAIEALPKARALLETSQQAAKKVAQRARD